MSNKTKNHARGLVANFTSPHELIHVAKQVHKLGIQRFDVFTPYPIHGLDEAMNVKPSAIPWVSLIFGLTGASLGILFQWWTSAVDYKLIIGGKPFFSWPAFIPVTFECGILLCALATFAALFYSCKLPKFSYAFEKDPKGLKATDDEFVIFIDNSDPAYQEQTLKEIFNKHHAKDIRILEGALHG